MDHLRSAWFWLVGRIGVNRLVNWEHRLLYGRFGGAGILGRSLGNLTVILITVGRHSGRVREVPLWAYPDHGRLVLVGTNGGRKPVPGWVFNLRGQPDARIRLGRTMRRVRSYEAAGDEWDRLWTLVTGAYPGYLAYQRWIQRPIPLVVLESADGRPLVEQPGLVELEEGVATGA